MICVLPGCDEDWLEETVLDRGAPPGSVPVALAPSEDVLLVTVELPAASHKNRLAALPYAVEHRLADPPADVHVALGPEIASGRNLAAVVSHARMAEWLDYLKNTESTAPFRIIPDALVLPIPPSGSWHVLARGKRVVVRLDDGTGFATRAQILPALWSAAGEPLLRCFGGALPEGLPGVAADDQALPFRISQDALNLRQGLYAPSRKLGSPALKRVAGILAAGAVAHAALAFADVQALRGFATQKQAEARKLLDDFTPGGFSGPDPIGQLARLLNVSPQATNSGFLPLLSRASSALHGFSPSVSLRALDYDATGGNLGLNLETSDLVALQRIETLLTQSGLSTASGAATSSGGGAQARLVVQLEPKGSARR